MSKNGKKYDKMNHILKLICLVLTLSAANNFICFEYRNNCSDLLSTYKKINTNVLWLFMIKKQQTHSKYQGCYSFWWLKPLSQYCCMNNCQYYVNPRFHFIEYSLICVYHIRWNNLCSFSIFSRLKLTGSPVSISWSSNFVSQEK